MQNENQASKLKLLGASCLALLLIVLLSSCGKNIAEMSGRDNTEGPAFNQSSSSDMNNGVVGVRFEETLFVPCANGGAGENVTFTGITNFIYQMAWNDHGFHLVYHANSHEVTGIGLSSGETFVGSDGTQGSVTASWVNNEWIGTTTEHMRFVGQNTTYTVKYKYHIIVTPDGNITVNISDKTIDCTSK